MTTVGVYGGLRVSAADQSVGAGRHGHHDLGRGNAVPGIGETGEVDGWMDEMDGLCLWIVLGAGEVANHGSLLWVHVQVAAAQTTQPLEVMRSKHASQYSLSGRRKQADSGCRHSDDLYMIWV